MDKENLKERLRARLEEDPNGCWKWYGGRDENELPYIFQGKVLEMKEYFFEIFLGPLPTRKYTVGNSCDKVGCFNPDHLCLVVDTRRKTDK